MSQIAAQPPPLCPKQLPMSSGIARNLIFRICEFGDVQLMFTSKRTSELELGLIWIFVGYPEGYKAWTFYNPTTRRTIISERAEFDERYFPGLKRTPLTPEPFELLPPVMFNPVLDSGGDNELDEPAVNPIQANRSPSPEIPPDIPAPLNLPPDAPAKPPVDPIPLEPVTPTSHPSSEPETSSSLPIALRRAKRNVRPPGEWWKLREPTPAISSDSEDGDDDDFAEFAGAAHDLDPNSMSQALQRSDGDKWKEAAKSEMDNHASNGTWKLVDLPPGAKCIGSGWVFRLKRNADGSIERYKARLVAKGYSPCPGFNYTLPPFDMR